MRHSVTIVTPLVKEEVGVGKNGSPMYNLGDHSGFGHKNMGCFM